MVSKRGKRKRSVEGASQGEQKRKRISGEKSVDSTSAGDKIPAEQADSCEAESSYTESQETIDMDQNAAVDSTADTTTLVTSQSFGQKGPADELAFCKDGGDAPTSIKENTKSPAVEDRHTSSAPAEASENMVTEEPVSEKLRQEDTDKCDDEADKTPTKENTLCDTSAEPVKSEEGPFKETQLDTDKRVVENSQKITVSPVEETDDKTNKSCQEMDVSQKPPLEITDCPPPSLEENVLISADLNKSTPETADGRKQDAPRDDIEEKIADEEILGMEKELESSQSPSTSRQDDQCQTKMTLSGETCKEKEHISDEVENVQNCDEITVKGQESPKPPSSNKQEDQSQTDEKMNKETDTEKKDKLLESEKEQDSDKENAVGQADKTKDTETNVSTTAETPVEQTTLLQHCNTEASPPKDDAKPVENEQVLKEVISKPQLAEPNQAGDFLDRRAFGKASTLSELSGESGKEKMDMPQETGACELKKDGSQLGDKHVSLPDKDWADSLAACGEELGELFDLPGSQEVKERMLMTSQGDGSNNSGSSRMEKD